MPKNYSHCLRLHPKTIVILYMRTMVISKNYAHEPVPGQIPHGLTLIALQRAYDPVCVLTLSNFSPEIVDAAALIMR